MIYNSNEVLDSKTKVNQILKSFLNFDMKDT